jgi:hypothetical protein
MWHAQADRLPLNFLAAEYPLHAFLSSLYIYLVLLAVDGGDEVDSVPDPMSHRLLACCGWAPLPGRAIPYIFFSLASMLLGARSWCSSQGDYCDRSSAARCNKCVCMHIHTYISLAPAILVMLMRNLICSLLAIPSLDCFLCREHVTGGSTIYLVVMWSHSLP